MNKPILLAALLALFTAVVHVVGGGADIARPLLDSPLDLTLKFTLYAVWHGISVTLACSGIALLFCARRYQAAEARLLATAVSLLWISFGGVFLAIAAAYPEHDLLFKLPQWILLLPVGLLGLWGRAGMPSQAKAS